jgi:hypothetical protein
MSSRSFLLSCQRGGREGGQGGSLVFFQQVGRAVVKRQLNFPFAQICCKFIHLTRRRERGGSGEDHMQTRQTLTSISGDIPAYLKPCSPTTPA